MNDQEDHLYSNFNYKPNLQESELADKHEEDIKEDRQGYCLRHQHSYKGKECDTCNHG